MLTQTFMRSCFFRSGWRVVPAALIAAAIAGTYGCASNQPTPRKFVLAATASKNPDEAKAAWRPLIEDLGKRLGVDADMIASLDKTEINNALRDGKADVIWTSSNPAIDAITQANGEVFALYISPSGAEGYKGVVIARGDSGISTLDEALAPGKYSYASGAKTSTSGYVLPQHFLFNRRNTTPEQLFKSVSYGSHFQNLDAIWGKKVDIAVNNTNDLETFRQKTPDARSGITVLWESPLVPNDVLLYRQDMPEARKKQLRDLFLNYGKNSEQEKERLRKANGISHFVPADVGLLEPVSEFKFATERNRIQQDARLSAEEKTKQLEAVSRQETAFKKALSAK